jgi:transcriptional regulator with XRE-family HTH domain
MGTTLGKRIGILRRQKELKQDELAAALGVSPQAVSKWENEFSHS